LEESVVAGGNDELSCVQPVPLADAQQGLAKCGHGAGVVFTLIMDGVEAVQGDDLDCVFYLAITVLLR
jgi:hypothetical protein